MTRPTRTTVRACFTFEASSEADAIQWAEWVRDFEPVVRPMLRLTVVEVESDEPVRTIVDDHYAPAA